MMLYLGSSRGVSPRQGRNTTQTRGLRSQRPFFTLSLVVFIQPNPEFYVFLHLVVKSPIFAFLYPNSQLLPWQIFGI